MKRTVSFVMVLVVLLSLMCSTAFGYAKNDHPIYLVTFAVSGYVSSDMSNVAISVKTPEKDRNYYYSGHELLGVKNNGEGNIVSVKLKFHAVNQHYFRITKASQITICGKGSNIKYVAAKREDDGYQLTVEVQFPADKEIDGTAELPEVSTSQEKWEQRDSKWYYMLSNGQYAKGWKQIDGDWYYFNSESDMAVDQWIEGTYYVGSNGKMLHDTVTPDGYPVGSDGKWVKGPQDDIQTKQQGMEKILAEYIRISQGDDIVKDIHIEGDDTISETIEFTFGDALPMEYWNKLMDELIQKNDVLMKAAALAYSEEYGFPVHLKYIYMVNGNTYAVRMY